MLVSVIMPAYNAENTIERAIESVLNQHGCELEIIVIDDGSTDRTLEILKRYSQHVKVLKQEHKGVSVARNSGISVAQGELIAFLDSDDIWYQGKLEYQIDLMKQHPEYGLVSTGADYFNNVGNKMFSSTKHTEGNIFNKLLRGNFIITSSVLVKTSILRSIGECFNEDLRIGEDWVLWLRIAARYKCMVSKKIFLRYQASPGSKYNNELFNEYHEKMLLCLQTDPIVSPFMKAIWSYWNSCRHFSLAARHINDRQYIKTLRHLVLAFYSKPTNILGFRGFVKAVSYAKNCRMIKE